MPSLQKKLLLAFAALLFLQAGANFVKYVLEGGRFGSDFIVFWHTAQMLVQGNIAAIYDLGKLKDILNPDVATTESIGPFIYPPYVLMPLLPLGGMGYNQAVAWWSLLPLPFYFTFFMLMLKNSALQRESKSSRYQAYAIGVASVLPLLSANLFTGQTSAFIAVLFLAACWFWARKPLLAGVCIGLIALKPQLGLLFPLALLASRQWRMIVAAAVTAIAMALAVTLWLGLPIWNDFITMTQLFSQYMKEGVMQFTKLALGPYVSLQMWRGIGVTPMVAAVAQGAITLGVMAVIVRVFRDKNCPPDLRYGLLACGALLATPYAMCYDSPLLALSLVPLLSRIWCKGFRNPLEILSFALVMVLPYLQPLLLNAHIPSGFLTLSLLFATLLWYKRQESY